MKKVLIIALIGISFVISLFFFQYFHKKETAIKLTLVDSIYYELRDTNYKSVDIISNYRQLYILKDLWHNPSNLSDSALFNTLKNRIRLSSNDYIMSYGCEIDGAFYSGFITEQECMPDSIGTPMKIIFSAYKPYIFVYRIEAQKGRFRLSIP